MLLASMCTSFIESRIYFFIIKINIDPKALSFSTISLFEARWTTDGWIFSLHFTTLILDLFFLFFQIQVLTFQVFNTLKADHGISNTSFQTSKLNIKTNKQFTFNIERTSTLKKKKKKKHKHKQT